MERTKASGRNLSEAVLRPVLVVQADFDALLVGTA